MTKKKKLTEAILTEFRDNPWCSYDYDKLSQEGTVFRAPFEMTRRLQGVFHSHGLDPKEVDPSAYRKVIEQVWREYPADDNSHGISVAEIADNVICLWPRVKIPGDATVLSLILEAADKETREPTFAHSLKNVVLLGNAARLFYENGHQDGFCLPVKQVAELIGRNRWTVSRHINTLIQNHIITPIARHNFTAKQARTYMFVEEVCRPWDSTPDTTGQNSTPDSNSTPETQILRDLEIYDSTQGAQWASLKKLSKTTAKTIKPPSVMNDNDRLIRIEKERTRQKQLAEQLVAEERRKAIDATLRGDES